MYLFFFSSPEFVSNFARLKDLWQAAARGIGQRKNNIDKLVRQWKSFTSPEAALLRFLTNTRHLLSAVKDQDCYSLCQARSLLQELKVVCVTTWSLWQSVFVYDLYDGGGQ